MALFAISTHAQWVVTNEGKNHAIDSVIGDSCCLRGTGTRILYLLCIQICIVVVCAIANYHFLQYHI